MKPRPDSYEAQLSEEELLPLHGLLLQPGLSLPQVQALAPVWKRGQYEGAKPSTRALSEIATRLRTDERLIEIEARAKMLEAVRKRIQAEPALAGTQEEILDTIMTLVGQEVIEKTLTKEDPKNRTAAARLLLKRRDQDIELQKLEWLKNRAAKADQAEATVQDETLTPAERQLKLKQIFGI